MYGQYPVEEQRTTPLELAPRSRRLFAALVDGALVLAFALIGALGAFAWGAGTMVQAAASGRMPSALPEATGAVTGLLFGSLAAAVGLMLYQWYGIIARGQTLGKRLFRIEIVDEAGAAGGFFRALLLRSWIFGLLSGVLQMVLGGFGLLLWLLDLLPIFGVQRRCLHDYLAGTWVRESRSSVLGAVPALALFGAAAVGLGALAGAAGSPLASLSQLRGLAARPGAFGSGSGPAFLEGIGDRRLPLESPMPGPGPTGDVRLEPPSGSERIYRWEDAAGVVHFTEELDSVPEKYRGRAQPID